MSVTYAESPCRKFDYIMTRESNQFISLKSKSTFASYEEWTENASQAKFFSHKVLDISKSLGSIHTS
jgi:hypothetical protein